MTQNMSFEKILPLCVLLIVLGPLETVNAKINVMICEIFAV